jgi:hypothetical protein
MIRLANMKDMDTIIDMFKRLFEFGNLKAKGLGFNEKNAEEFITGLILDGEKILILSHDDKNITGAIGGMASPWVMDLSQKCILEQAFGVYPEFRTLGHDKDLIDAFMSWGEIKGASFVMVSSMDEDRKELVEKYFRMHGFSFLETYFVREI